MDHQLDANYWNNRYLAGQTGWDIGYASTPLKTYIDQLADKSMRILVPGCGNAYEVKYLLEQGFENITVIDIAPALTAALEKELHIYLGTKLSVITGDFFSLSGHFDLVLEQTFFCALDPSLREAYVQKMHMLLKPEGKLAGVLFNREFAGGPPFGGSLAEYQILFAPYFEVKKMEPCYNSIESRNSSELFIILAAKPHQ